VTREIGIHFARVLERLGIADEVNKKAIRPQRGSQVADATAALIVAPSPLAGEGSRQDTANASGVRGCFLMRLYLL